MKVALIVPGGVDRSGEYRVIPCLLWLIERLARTHDVHVFALYQDREPAHYPLLGAAVHSIGWRKRRRRTFSAIISEHRRSPFDVFHAFWAAPAGTVAAVLGKVLARPVVVHVAGGELVRLDAIDYGGLRTLRGRVMVRIALAGATRVTAASPRIIEEGARLGVQVERLVLGVDLSRWPPRGPRRRDRDAPARLVHVGSLNRVKDQATLLRAAAAVRRSGRAFRLDVVGEDTLDGELQRLADALGLTDVVAFHGFLPHAALRPLVDAADLLVMSSLHEGGEVVTLEAAVVGVPAVGTRVGHIAAWAPEAAVAVPVGDADALARAIMRMLDDEDYRLRVALEAQRRAVACDADATAARVGSMYERLIVRARPARPGPAR